METQKLQLELTIQEANMILAALGDKPYIKVADLIHKIKDQAASQMTSETISNTFENVEEEQIEVEDEQ